jgi:molybdenum-dependent DNA-binding transcriptional regulator ModE
MRYRLDEIAAFLQVVETGSISAAAGRLGLAKSVVSKRITDLEATLGVGLLHRSTRGVVPTDKESRSQIAIMNQEACESPPSSQRTLDTRRHRVSDAESMGKERTDKRQNCSRDGK